MGFFGKNKKDSSPASKTAEARPDTQTAPNENIVYRDGVFEVFENTDDGKKYGRILKYHGTTKCFEISEEEFSLWKDASENFSRYRITYERDEDFFIEKASIELATTPDRGIDGKEKSDDDSAAIGAPEAPAQAVEELSEEEKQYRRELIEFYNTAVQSPDFGEEAMKNATLDQCFSSSALADRKIAEQIARQKKEFKEKGLTGTPEKPLNLELPVSLGKLSEFSKRRLYQLARERDKLYILYSDCTKRPHSANGNALIAFSEETANAALRELTDRNQKVSIRTVERDRIPAEFSNIMVNGFVGMRFMHKYGMATIIRVNTAELGKKIAFPENIALRRTMTGFFQDLRNGIPAEKLQNAEIALYDALFRATLLQPCVKGKDGEGKDTLTVSIVKDNKGACLLDLYTSQALLENSASYLAFAKQNPDTVGYKRWSIDEVLQELGSSKTPANGFIIDKDNVPVPFSAGTLEKVRRMKELWEKNGKTFLKKPEKSDN